MISQTTKGIKISVETQYEGSFFKSKDTCYVFNYKITIENTTDDTVQILSRHWEIYDSLKNTEIIEGEGIIGETPIIAPGEKHTYRSGCILKSSLGSMQGYYNVLNHTHARLFKVTIPNFKLSADFVLN
ncbi:Co2+/Mg2+ efflux protein ApaG [Myroides phaeus]|uniref:ApaG protein n=1 Tax=Myroides phaeus TaxID=702745 RepID=A0A1G8C6E8_9FLAO|nr:Co2+/Mg2+ efflux protein ApaG [Myroides phaeus]MEC4115456.1 Co2+/Mg2+ efflux protein ApaG [Myroides phaeus]SDH40954.1 ApaG protein [Myroides phaeus]